MTVTHLLSNVTRTIRGPNGTSAIIPFPVVQRVPRSPLVLLMNAPLSPHMSFVFKVYSRDWGQSRRPSSKRLLKTM